MPANKASKTKSVRTTTLTIKPAHNFTELEKRFCLVRFELPPGLAYGNKNANYARVHTAMKESLNAPYRLFTYDGMKHDQWVVFALFPNNIKSPYTVIFDGKTYTGVRVGFDVIKYHVLIKLLQVAYFRESVRNAERFVGWDKCFVQVMKDRRKTDHYLCLQMEITQSRNDADYTFFIDEHAHYFALTDKEEVQNNGYRDPIYAQVYAPSGQMIAFRQLKVSEIGAYPQSLFVSRSYSSARPTLDYHSIEDDSIEATRGYHLYVFIADFSKFLIELGFSVTPLKRTFHEYATLGSSAFELPVKLLQTVYVLDVRFARINIPITSFLAPFQRVCKSAVNFQPIDSMADLPVNTQPVVLVFQDAIAAAFGDNGPLVSDEYEDPYPALYQKYSHIPKQFVNVNENDLSEWIEPEELNGKKARKALSAEDYLTYDVWKDDKKSRQAHDQIAQVAMHELFLKDWVIYQRPVIDRLPAYPTDWMFIHKENRGIGKDTTTFKVALRIVNGVPQFLEWNERDKDEFWKILDGWEIADEFETLFHKDKYEDNLNPGERPNFDIVAGDGFCLRIDALPETVLYDYATLVANRDVNIQQHPIDDLRLLPHFDTLKKEDAPTRETVEFILQTQGTKVEKLKTSTRDAVYLYDQLRRFNKVLDAYVDDNPDVQTLSLDQLTEKLETGDGLGERVRAIFDDSKRAITNFYAKLGLFGSLRSGELAETYKGIWFTDENQYLVGSPNAMPSVQDKAQIVREVIFRKGNMDLGHLLELTSVTFVRLNQYTVIPYQFHLIQLYIDNVLQYSPKAN